MNYIYTQSYIQSRMAAGIQNKIGMLIDPVATVNQGARELNKKLLLESRTRKENLSPSVVTGKYDYILPADFSGKRIIDIPSISARRLGSLEIISAVEFDTRPRFGSIAFKNYNGIKLLKLYASNQSSMSLVSQLSSLTADGGTWVLSGDGSNVRVDTNNYPYINPVIAFDVAATGLTTAGIKNTALTSFDISKFISSDGMAKLNVYLNSALTVNSITLKLGSDSSNYYSITVTKQFDGSDFVAGDNTLYFRGFTATGSPVATAIVFGEIILNISSGHAVATDFAVSGLSLLRGIPTPIIYYSTYNWVANDNLTYKLDATSPLDYLIADTDDVDLHINEAVICAMRELGFPQSTILAEENRQAIKIKEYIADNPSDVLTYTTIYQDFSGDGFHTYPTNDDATFIS